MNPEGRVFCKNALMATPPIASVPAEQRASVLGKTRLVSLVVLFALLAVCLVFSWSTRDAMAHLPFLNLQGGSHARLGTKKNLVDLSPWQTAQALAPLAVSGEETEYAREAERLADHEVDQAFAAALRLASLQDNDRVLTGQALVISKRIEELQQLIKQDNALVDSLTAKSGSGAAPVKAGASVPASADDIEVAKAQLGLDTDELSDAQRELERLSGDDSVRIQEELTAHEASMRQYDSESHSYAPIAVLSVKRYGTLAGRVKAWFSQRDRAQLLEKARVQTQKDSATLTAEYDALEAKANANEAAPSASAADHAAKLVNISDRRAVRQILGIYDDRIQTEQQLATVYSKWSAQLLLQHRIVLHLILQSLSVIVFIAICMVLLDALVRRLMSHSSLDRRQIHTLRSIIELSIQVLGALLILLVIFGFPQETPTILGLATAALTIALQDFIIAFLGWFVLMGKNGIHVGDWVEINGVGGEVTEVGLIYTSLLETGTLADKGYATGRRITFINSFAIRGKYFNFSTTGQWMWDEVTVTVPASDDTTGVVERIQKRVLEEMKENTRLAEKEWKRGTRGDGLSRFSAEPVVSLRPTASGVDIEVRYMTRASERFEVRNHLNERLIDLLHAQPRPEPAA